MRTSAISGLTGLQDGGGSINVQGEEQKKLDVISNNVLKNALRWSGELATIASEEEDAPVNILGDAVFSNDIIVDNSGRYVAVFDPLDGSSNVDAGIPVGTIFGIFDSAECSIEDLDLSDGIDKAEEKCLQDTLQPGTNLVAAGYCLYSSSTSFVFTLGSGVYGFTLDESIGEFVLTHPDMKIPPRGKIYSFNEANHWDWDPPLQQYVADIQQGLVRSKRFELIFLIARSFNTDAHWLNFFLSSIIDHPLKLEMHRVCENAETVKGESESRYSSRYIGSMVGDVHRTLQYGGIFGYPADKRNPNGKLRLLYEAAPMAFLLEQVRNEMSLFPQNIHNNNQLILIHPS